MNEKDRQNIEKSGNTYMFPGTAQDFDDQALGDDLRARKARRSRRDVGPDGQRPKTHLAGEGVYAPTKTSDLVERTEADNLHDSASRTKIYVPRITNEIKKGATEFKPAKEKTQLPEKQKKGGRVTLISQTDDIYEERTVRYRQDKPRRNNPAASANTEIGSQHDDYETHMAKEENRPLLKTTKTGKAKTENKRSKATTYKQANPQSHPTAERTLHTDNRKTGEYKKSSHYLIDEREHKADSLKTSNYKKSSANLADRREQPVDNRKESDHKKTVRYTQTGNKTTDYTQKKRKPRQAENIVRDNTVSREKPKSESGTEKRTSAQSRKSNEPARKNNVVKVPFGGARKKKYGDIKPSDIHITHARKAPAERKSKNKQVKHRESTANQILDRKIELHFPKIFGMHFERFFVFALFIAVTLLLGAAVFYAGTKVPKLFCKVRNIKVSGGSYYDAEEIIACSEIKKGMSIFNVDKQKTESNIERRLPFVDVTVSFTWIDTVKISVTDRKAYVAVECRGKYLLVSDAMTALSFVTEQELAENYSELTVIEGIGTDSYRISENISELSDPHIADAFLVLKEAEDARLQFVITYIDVLNTNEIVLCTDNGTRILIGTTDNLSEKMQKAARYIPRIQSSGAKGGVLDVRQGANYVPETHTETFTSSDRAG